MSLPVIDHRYAHCEECPLDAVRSQYPAIEVLAEVGRRYQPGGLMIVGEAPGKDETVLRRPFVGAAGRCLDELLASCNIPRDTVVISNALLCRPRANEIDGAPFSVERCNGRLFAEINAYQPRVILALGNHAMRAVVGRNVTKSTYRHDQCDVCEGRGKVLILDALWMSVKLRNKQATIRGGNHEIPCQKCKGEGMRRYGAEVVQLSTDRKILDSAGAIVSIWGDSQWAHLQQRFSPNTRYVISTYHPSFLIRERDKKAGDLAGSFFRPYAERHFQRAARLLRMDYSNDLEPVIVDEEAKAPQLAAWLQPAPGRLFSVDIETDPKDEADYALPHEWVENEFEGGLICVSCGSPEDDPRALVPCTAILESEDEEGSRKKVHLNPLLEKITCVGVARLDTNVVVVVDTRERPVASLLWQALIPFLQAPDCAKVFHNGVFDIAVLEAVINGIEI